MKSQLLHQSTSFVRPPGSRIEVRILKLTVLTYDDGTLTYEVSELLLVGQVVTSTGWSRRNTFGAIRDVYYLLLRDLTETPGYMTTICTEACECKVPTLNT